MTSQQNHNFASPLRYPGGKGGLSNFMKVVVSQNNLLDGDYVEIYAGGAGIAWSLLFEEYVRRVHVNDLNKSLMAFWRSILEKTDEFCRLVRDTPTTMEEWHRQHAIQNTPDDHSMLELGFSTFFLNRTNRSGILKGGVIGGKDQTGEWKIDARFNRQDLIKRIQRIGRYANRIRLYNLDAIDFIKIVLPTIPQKALVYLDPPYFNKGQELYENHYGKEDHANIASLVFNEIKQPWIVSYDATPEIMELYKKHRNIQYSIRYSARERYAGSEVIFYKRGLKVPDTQSPTSVKLPTFQRPLL
jgi:DNA adenine methylase